MNIVYLVPRETYERKMSRVRFQQVAYIGRHPGARVIISGPGWPDWDDSVSAAVNLGRLRMPTGTEPEVAIAYDVEGLAGAPMPILTQFNEAYDEARVEAYVRRNRISSVVFHHANDLPRYGHWDELGIERHHLHHCADPAIYKDYALERTTDILVVGNLQDREYPFRNRLWRLATRVLKKRGYQVRWLKHPGYVLPARDGTAVGAEYARAIASSKIVLTCSGRMRYAYGKYSEIAMCGALPCGDLPDERHEFFKDVILHVESWMLDSEILRRIEDVLDEEGEWERRAQRARELTEKTSSMEQYAGRFVDVVRPWLERWQASERARLEEQWRQAEDDKRRREEAALTVDRP